MTQIQKEIKLLVFDAEKEYIKDRCPICGSQFDEIKEEGNICGLCGYIAGSLELISEDEDYAWVL